VPAHDRPKEAASRGRLVIWEESARDGAQAKTIMSGRERARVARETGDIFGAEGPSHVIFAAGFPAIGPEEMQAMRVLAESVDNCSLASHGRATRHDVDLGLTALRNAAHPRVTFWIPVSDAMSRALGMPSRDVALVRGLDCLAYALDAADGIPIDVALTDAPAGDPQYVAHAAAALSDAGASIVKVCDSVGRFFPRHTAEFVQKLLADPAVHDAVVGVHLHNDLGFALANNLEAVANGVRVVASSWMGLGERNGLAATEQLLFALSGTVATAQSVLGEPVDLWETPPDLRRIVPAARAVSRITGVPLKVTDPISGTGVNAISTGTPFLDRDVFRPFDPMDVLGVEPRIEVTQLASKRVLQAVAAERGMVLSNEELDAAMRWVKSEAYARNVSIIDKRELFGFLARIVAMAAVGE
jgi:2-isopropylmalate synthase